MHSTIAYSALLSLFLASGNAKPIPDWFNKKVARNAEPADPVVTDVVYTTAWNTVWVTDSAPAWAPSSAAAEPSSWATWKPSSAPAKPTSVPAEPSSWTAWEPSSTPVESSYTAVKPTSTAVESSYTPVKPTSTPVEPTSTPVAPTSAPAKPTSTPVASPSSVAASSAMPSGTGTPESAYQCFTGAPAGYPEPADWLSFDELWAANENSVTEAAGAAVAATVKATIQTMGTTLNFDPRFILAVAMQESTGNPAAPCTGPPGTECGLMQSGTATGASSITQQIQYGVNGDASTDECGYGQLLHGSAGCENEIAPGNYFMAAYLYNVGSAPATCTSATDCNLNAPPADGTKQYATDLANRLMGWQGEGKASC